VILKKLGYCNVLVCIWYVLYKLKPAQGWNYKSPVLSVFVWLADSLCSVPSVRKFVYCLLLLVGSFVPSHFLRMNLTHRFKNTSEMIRCVFVD